MTQWQASTSTSATETAVVVISITSAALYLARVGAEPSRTRMIYKALSTALLSVFAALRASSASSASPHAQHHHVLALILGAVGDAFLAWPGETRFLYGLASFLAAHLFYIVLFLRTGTLNILRDGDDDDNGGLGIRKAIAGVMLLLFAPGMATLLVPRVPSRMRAPVLAYTAAVLALVLAALAAVRSRAVVGGALLFALSDSVLAAEEFVVARESRHRPWMQHVVWVLYYSGQFLIASGF